MPAADRDSCLTGVLALHGGAGVIDRASFGQQREQHYRAELKRVLNAGWTMLSAGASAQDTVEETICLLEDSPCFNAGCGSVLNRDGQVEMDAALMDGGRNCGGVAAVKQVRNPIRAARRVMDRTEHVLLVGPAADQFADQQGLALSEQSYFITPDRQAQLANASRAGRISLDHDEQYGTVGAVALDQAGNLAAGSSTGGMTNKLPGRVGDSPLVGAGVWADSNTCAVSGTGHGEYFMRAALAHDVHARMEYGGKTLAEACDQALDEIKAMGGSGGCIGVDAAGCLVLKFNSPGMYRAWVGTDGRQHVAIYADE